MGKVQRTIEQLQARERRTRVCLPPSRPLPPRLPPHHPAYVLLAARLCRASRRNRVGLFGVPCTRLPVPHCGAARSPPSLDFPSSPLFPHPRPSSRPTAQPEGASPSPRARLSPAASPYHAASPRPAAAPATTPGLSLGPARASPLPRARRPYLSPSAGAALSGAAPARLSADLSTASPATPPRPTASASSPLVLSPTPPRECSGAAPVCSPLGSPATWALPPAGSPQADDSITGLPSLDGSPSPPRQRGPPTPFDEATLMAEFGLPRVLRSTALLEDVHRAGAAPASMPSAATARSSPATRGSGGSQASPTSGASARPAWLPTSRRVGSPSPHIAERHRRERDAAAAAAAAALVASDEELAARAAKAAAAAASADNAAAAALYNDPEALAVATEALFSAPSPVRVSQTRRASASTVTAPPSRQRAGVQRAKARAGVAPPRGAVQFFGLGPPTPLSRQPCLEEAPIFVRPFDDEGFPPGGDDVSRVARGAPARVSVSLATLSPLPRGRSPGTHHRPAQPSAAVPAPAAQTPGGTATEPEARPLFSLLAGFPGAPRPSSATQFRAPDFVPPCEQACLSLHPLPPPLLPLLLASMQPSCLRRWQVTSLELLEPVG